MGMSQREVRRGHGRTFASLYSLLSLPQPEPGPTLPAAGGTFTDPTFGTTIIRVTDRVNAPTGVETFSDAADMQWNCDGTLFLLPILGGGGYRLFGFNRSTYALTNIGALTTCVFDGAQWHPTERDTLFAGDLLRTIYKFTSIESNLSPTSTVHDFTPQISLPASPGYSSSRIGLSDTARYVMMSASSLSGGSQEEKDYVVVWDTQSSSVAASLHVPTQFGAGAYLHAADWVPGDTYIRLSGGGGTPIANKSYLWNWGAGTFSAALTSVEDFAGHITFGSNVMHNPAVGNSGPGGDRWLTRTGAAPLTVTTLFDYPLRNSTHTYLWDDHGSRVLPNGRFSDDPQMQPLTFTWTNHAGSVWKVANYTAQSLTYAALPPDTAWEGNTNVLTKVGAIPTGAGQFYYDSGADVLYAWLHDSSNPNGNVTFWVFPWVPVLQEVVMNEDLGGGAWRTRRLCHHRARKTASNFYSYPLAHPDPQGRFVLFLSNWGDASAYMDAFIVDGGA